MYLHLPPNPVTTTDHSYMYEHAHVKDTLVFILNTVDNGFAVFGRAHSHVLQCFDKFVRIDLPTLTPSYRHGRSRVANGKTRPED